MSTRRPRSKFVTDPIHCDASEPLAPNLGSQETEFEKPRGISRIEVRTGYAQAHVTQLGADLVAGRLDVLELVAASGVSIDFLKFTPSGLTFLMAEADSARVESALAGTTARVGLRSDQAMVMVHAVNMRDEEGLIARIVSAAIASGARIDHLGDMHDRLLISTSRDGARTIEAAIAHLKEGAAG